MSGYTGHFQTHLPYAAWLIDWGRKCITEEFVTRTINSHITVIKTVHSTGNLCWMRYCHFESSPEKLIGEGLAALFLSVDQSAASIKSRLETHYFERAYLWHVPCHGLFFDVVLCYSAIEIVVFIIITFWSSDCILFKYGILLFTFLLFTFIIYFFIVRIMHARSVNLITI